MRKTLFKKIGSLLLVLSMILSMFSACLVFAGENEKMEYTSSENFSTATGDGLWDNGIWRAQVLEQTVIDGALSDGNYVALTYSGTNYNWPTGTGAYYASTDTISNGSHLVGAKEMRPPKNYVNGDLGDKSCYSVVKTFTAPKAGNVTISCNGDFSVGMAYLLIAYVKLEKKDGSIVVLQTEGCNSANTNLWLKDIEATLEEGDKIHFQIGRRAQFARTTSEWNSHILWDPRIVYKAEEVEETVDDKSVYISSENFKTTSGDGTWEKGIWKAQVLEQTVNNGALSDENYVALTYSGTNYNWPTGTGAYYASTDTISNGSHLVGAKEMRPPKNYVNGDLGDKVCYSVVKTFTAPKAGDVSISCNGDFSVGMAYLLIAYVKLEKKDGNIEVLHTEGCNSANTNLWLTNIEATLEEGDKIHFQIGRRAQFAYTTSEWNTHVVWDPKITYIEDVGGGDDDEPLDIPDDDRVCYKSSDAFSEETNKDNVWRWQYFDVLSSTYNDLTIFKNACAGLENQKESRVTGWSNQTNSTGVKVSKYGLMAAVDKAKEATASDDDIVNHGVKSFRAPKSGLVTISVDESQYEMRGNHSAWGTRARIMKIGIDGETTQLWPDDPEEKWVLVSNVASEFNFENITTSINFGEQLKFECTYSNNNTWASAIFWDPVITYDRIYPVIKTFDPVRNATDVPPAYEHNLTFDKAIHDINASDVVIKKVEEDGTEIAIAATCEYSNVNDKTLSLKFNGLEEFTTYNVYINGVCYADLDVSDNSCVCKLSFTTGKMFKVFTPLYTNGSVKYEIYNSKEATNVTIIALVCNGTEDNYTVEKAYFATKKNVTLKDSIDVSVPLSGGRFIKSILVDTVLNAYPYSDIAVLKAGE